MELLHRTCMSLLVFVLISLSACVSKKKYTETMAALNEEKAMQEAQFKVQMDNANNQIEDLTLQLAERKGENNILLSMQERYENQIRNLEKEMEQMNTSAVGEKEQMEKNLEEKQNEIAKKEQQIQMVRKVIRGDEAAVIKMADAIKEALPDLVPEEMMVEVKDGKATITLFEKLMFRTGSVSRLQPKGLETLEKIAAVLLEYPQMFVTVIGHTDNKPPAIKSYKDNWNFSSLRGATIVRNLVNEFEIGANQVLAAGKGEFAPKSSNESAEGRAKNRRMELIIAPSIEDQARRIRAALR